MENCPQWDKMHQTVYDGTRGSQARESVQIELISQKPSREGRDGLDRVECHQENGIIYDK